jgi:putative SOS response-associated peptidase YedK
VKQQRVCSLIGDYDAWLDDGSQDLLRPYPASALFVRPVSSYVNKVQNQGERCVEEA